MRKIMLSALVCFAATVSLKSNPQAASNGLTVDVTYGFIQTGSPELLLDGNVYLTNTSDKDIHVVTGPILGPRLSTGLISYRVALSSSELKSGVTIKPTPGQLDIVTLAPGEVVVLNHFRKNIRPDLDETKIFYSIEPALRKFYPGVWIGEIVVILPMGKSRADNR